MSFDPGDPWGPELEVYDSNKNLVDATVSVVITAPDGTTTTPSVTHVTTGVYTTTVTLTTAGAWMATWTVVGRGVETQYAYVRRLGSNVISVQDVKDRLNKTLTVDDDEIANMLDAALAEYELYVGPVSGTVTELHDGGRNAIVLRNPYAAAVTAAQYTDGTTISVTDLNLDTASGIVYWNVNTTGRFTLGSRNVQVTYTIPPMPANHRETVIADVAGYFDATQRGPAGLPGEGYAETWSGTPMVLFPRIRALAAPSIA